MEFLGDVLMICGAIGAGVYCLVLSKRLSRFTDLENGIGGAVAILAVQVDDLKKAIDDAKQSSEETYASLQKLTRRADETACRLEFLLASTHDIGPRVPGVEDGNRSVRRKRRVQSLVEERP